MSRGLPRVVEETLQAFVGEVRRRFGARVADVRLFGSYARGEAHEESDVDVLVLLADATREEERSIVELAADLIWQLHGVVISPLCMSPDELEAWKASERRAALEIAAEGISL